MKVMPKKFISIVILMFILITSCGSQITNANFNFSTGKPLNVAVLIYNENDFFLSLIKRDLENIQKENEDKVKFTFFDAKRNISIAYEIVDKLSQDNYDFLLLSINTPPAEDAEKIIASLKKNNLPFVLFASEVNDNLISNYKKAIIMGSSIVDPGSAQGKIIVDAWNADKNTIDKNKDNKLQYILLKGNPNFPATTARTNSALETIHKAGIETEELASVNGYWDKQLAKTAMESLFLRYGNRVEAVISNNDAMAIGAIEALQKYGYNKGNKSKTIPVVGFDAIPEAEELIKKGIMLGSVKIDAKAIAELLYNVGVNLYLGKSPIEGTDYKLNSSGTVILPTNIQLNPITAKELNIET